MYVLVDPNNVVVAKGDTYENLPNGILIGGVIYAETTLSLVETELEVTPQLNTLIDGVVGINTGYKAPDPTLAELFESLRENQLILMDAVATLYEDIVLGGV